MIFLGMWQFFFYFTSNLPQDREDKYKDDSFQEEEEETYESYDSRDEEEGTYEERSKDCKDDNGNNIHCK